MTIDRRLQEQVLAALEREPGVDAAHVGVSVLDGVVTLQGLVATFRQKWLAERTTRRLVGVRAIANDLDVASSKPPISDGVIAQAVADALKWDNAIPAGRVKATVRHGWVTLTGTTTWQFQRSAAERVAALVNGVKGVVNSIAIEPQMSVGDLQSRIEDALRHAAEAEAHGIRIEARDGTVVLSGTVHSASEREAAERAAVTAPGVTRVDDRLIIVP
jgi:osmotically-inducible protein OsmY